IEPVAALHADIATGELVSGAVGLGCGAVRKLARVVSQPLASAIERVEQLQRLLPLDRRESARAADGFLLEQRRRAAHTLQHGDHAWTLLALEQSFDATEKFPERFGLAALAPHVLLVASRHHAAHAQFPRDVIREGFLRHIVITLDAALMPLGVVPGAA